MADTPAEVLARAGALARLPRRERERLNRYASMLRSAPPARQELLLLALRYLGSKARGPTHDAPARLRAACPYPGVPAVVAARLLLGESPAAISRGLTRAEAHRWLSERPTRPASEWLLEQHDLHDHPAYSVAVARWLIARDADPAQREALWRDREQRGPHGERIAGSYIERIDELRDRDLVAGVEETYRRAADRMRRDVERLMTRKGAPLRAPPAWWRPVRCARLLLSAADLVIEGRVMAHCVAGYAGYVARGESGIVALDVRGHRSTVELSADGRTVRQHKGPCNARPHRLCDLALAVCLHRWRKYAQ